METGLTRPSASGYNEFVTRSVPAALLVAAVLVLTACVPTRNQAGPGGYPARPAIVIVRPFEASESVVVLDPSFGFSLQRGMPGVPRTERAAAVERAVAANLSDALTEELKAAGLDAVSVSAAASPRAANALVVSGVFRRINEGLRRRVGQVAPGAGASRIVADVQIDYTAPGSAVRQLLALHADSEEPADGDPSRSPAAAGSADEFHGLRVADVDADARRVGRTIAQSVIDLARRVNWLGPGS